MKVLVAPLNWGLGHASRCVPLVHRFLLEGHEVILGGDGESLTLLRRHFPNLRYVYLAPLQLRYSSSNRQVWAICKAIPRLIVWSIKDHTMLRAVLREEHVDRVVSDNRFGLYNPATECIYLTHQLRIFLPQGWRWAEPLASRVHSWVYKHYNAVWVPDYEDIRKSLAGELSHLSSVSSSSCVFTYIGPLSRFSLIPLYAHAVTPSFDVVAVLSGLEPQRSRLEAEIKQRFAGSEERVLIVQGLMNRPNTRFRRGNITIVPYLNDEEFAKAFLGAKHIIARSGYSTIMDLAALGLFENHKSLIELIPTPGQPEQEYLAVLHCKK